MATEDVGRLRAELDLVPRMEKVRAAIAELARMERQAAGGAGGVAGTDRTETARAIASQVAQVRKDVDLNQRALRQAGPQEGLPSPQSYRIGIDRQISQWLKTTLGGSTKSANLDAELSKAVRNLVGDPGKQRRFYKEQDAALGHAEGNRIRNDPDYAATRANDLVRRQADDEARRLRGAVASPDFKQSLLGVDVASKQLFAGMEGMRFGSAEFKQAATEGAVTTRRLRSEIQLAAQAEEAYVRATADLASGRRKLAAESTVAQFGESSAGLSDEQTGDRAALLLRQQRLRDTGRRESAAAGDPEEVALRTRVRAARTATDRAARLSDEGVEVERSRVDANRELRNRILASAAGYDDTDIIRRGGLEAAGAQASWVAAQRRRGAVAAGITDDEIREAAQERAAMAGVNNAIKAREKEILKQMIQEGELGGTATQRRLALWSPGTRTPADFAGGLDNLKSKAFTTLGYGASAVGTGFLFQGISDAVKEAGQLEGTFVRMQGQLSALNRSGDMSEVRSEIKSISTSTGVAATDVAEFTSRMLGVFSDQSTGYALQQTNAAMQLMVVTGLDAKTMMQSVIPIAKAFGVGVEEIGNIAVQSGEQLGVSEEQMIEFLGKSATVAKQTGLDMRTLAIIGGTMAQNLGKDLSSSADVLNKMPELVSRNQAQIFDILRSAPSTAGFVQTMQEALGAGKGGEAYIQLLRAVALSQDMARNNQAGGLSETAIGEIPKLAGNQREIEDVTAQVANAGIIISRLDGTLLNAKGSDALQTRFEKLQGTVTQTFERIQRAIESFAESLFDLGIGEFFASLGKSIEVVLGTVGLFTKALTGLNDFTKSFGLESGLINPLIGAGVQIGAIIFTIDKLLKLKQRFLPTNQAVATSEAEESAARGVNAAQAAREAEAIAAADAVRARGVGLNAARVAPNLATQRARLGMPLGGGIAEAGLTRVAPAGLARLGPMPLPTSAATAAARYGGLTGAPLPSGTIGNYLLRNTPQVSGEVSHATNYARFGALSSGRLTNYYNANTAGDSLTKYINPNTPLVTARAQYANTLYGPMTQRAGKAFGDAASSQLVTAGKSSASVVGATMATRMASATNLLQQRIGREMTIATARSIALADAGSGPTGRLTRGQIVAGARPSFAGLGAGLSRVGQSFSRDAPVNESSAAFRFAQLGSSANYASFLSRATSGGGQNMLTSRIAPLRNLAAGGNAATAAAGQGQGIIASGLTVPAIGIAIAGITAAYSSWSGKKEETEAATNEFREKVKTANKDRLQEVVDGGHSVLDSIGAFVFQESLPDEIARAGIAYQNAKPAADLLAGLDQSGLGDAFIKRVQDSDPVRQRMTDFFNQRDEQGNLVNRDLAEELNISGAEGDGLFKEYSDEAKRKMEVSRSGLSYRVDKAQVPTVIKRARELLNSKDPKQQEQASRLAQMLGTDILDLPGFEDLKRAAQSGKQMTELQKAVEDAGGGGAYATKKYDELKRAYDQGKLPLGAFLSRAQAARDQAMADTAGMLGDQKKEALAAIDEMDAEIQKTRDGAVKARLDAVIEIARMSGRPDIEQFAVQKMIEALPTFSKSQQIEMLPTILDQLQKGFNERVESIADPIQRANARLAGFEIPDVVQRLQVETEIRNTESYATGLDALAPWFAKSTDQMIEWVAQQVKDTDMSIIDVVNTAMSTRRQGVLDRATADREQGTFGGLFRSNLEEQEADDILTKEGQNVIDIGGDATQQLVGGMAGYFNLDTLGMAKEIAEKSHEWNLSTAATIVRLLKERREKAIEAGVDPNDPAIKFLDELIASAENEADAGKVNQPAEQSFQQKRDFRRKDLEAIAADQKANIDIAAAGLRGDPLAQDQAALDKAWKDYGVALQLQSEGLDDPTARKQAWLNVLEQMAKVEDDRQELALMSFEWEEFYANGDPQKEIQARLGKARAVLAKAISDAGGNMQAVPVQRALLDVQKLERDGVDANLNVQRSTFSVLSAQAARDPVKTAQIAQAQAAFELANARGKVDENEKLAAKIRADQSLEDTMSQLYESRANLAIALAEAAGDPVKAAELAAKEAQRKLDEAIAQGAGEGTLNQLKGSLATANENYGKTGRSNEQSIIDFQLQMGEITTSTAIESLRLILSRTRVGTEEYRQLALKIRQLEQQAGQDLQFNLPTQLGLPTLYEARRVTQSTAAGIGYQDNRSVSLVVQVNGAQDAMAITNQVMTAFSSAMGNGRTFTPQVGVGV